MIRYVAPCRDDPKCYRSEGHEGPHAYPDDSPQATTYIDPCPVCGRRPNARMRKWLASEAAPTTSSRWVSTIPPTAAAGSATFIPASEAAPTPHAHKWTDSGQCLFCTTMRGDIPASEAAPVIGLSEAEVAVLEKAVAIGAISHDGDGWFAKEAGYDYDDAEATFLAARAILARPTQTRTLGEAG